MTTPVTRPDLLALTLRDLPSSAKPLSAAEAWAVLADKPLDVDLSSRIAHRRELVDGLEGIVDRYAEQGVWILSAVDEAFPRRLAERLGPRAPVLFYGVGNARLLADDGIGVVGSRDLDDAATGVAQDIGHTVARAGLTLISGGARGVDVITMNAATSAGGSAVGVLVHPLLKEARRGGVGELIQDERLCLITPFVPSTGFVVANAMARNKIIYALSRTTFVVTSDRGKGGTWSGATEAIRRGYSPVAVWSGAGHSEGNQALIKAGGIPVDHVDDILEVDRSALASTAAPQLSLEM